MVTSLERGDHLRDGATEDEEKTDEENPMITHCIFLHTFQPPVATFTVAFILPAGRRE